MHHFAVLVAQDLHLYMARFLDELLQVHGIVAEGRSRFGASIAERRGQMVGRRHHAHSLAAATGGRLEHHRIADLLGESERGLGIGQRIATAGNHWNAGVDHQPTAFDLRAHGGDGGRRRADEDHTLLFAHAGETGVLG